MTRIRGLIKQPQHIRLLHESGYTGLFVCLFLGLILPFRLDTMQSPRYTYVILMSLACMLVSYLMGLIQTYLFKMPLDPQLPLKQLHRNSLASFILSIPFIAVALNSLSGYYINESVASAWWQNGHIYLDTFLNFLYYVSATSLFMIIGAYIRNRNCHLNAQLEEMRTINALLEKRQQALIKSEEERETTTQVPVLGEVKSEEKTEGITLMGNTCSSVLEVHPEAIIYVESMANYADIWYMADDEPHHKTLRITLKQIKESLDELPYMVQCHRAFIVNLNFVMSMTNRSSGFQLHLFGTEKQIPVSRSFTPLVKEKLQPASHS